MASLREAIDKHCRSCIFDDLAAGTWRQQVTFCAVKSCDLYEVRPKTTSTIPESVYSSHGAKLAPYEELKAISESG